ncbi:hypothetical protein ABT304_21025 [Nocardioides sp. NPDC000445]|uniref:hypothetical protein n=1 Tax=Nocardioides sp. NPDC000445 TaxID=3154257 RepID=UPI00331CF5DF
MSGEESVNPHVFQVEPYGRLLRRYRWRCSCGATGSGFIMKTSAVFYGDTHALQSDQVTQRGRTMTNTIEEEARTTSWRVTRSISSRFDNIEDPAAEEKAWADFGCRMLMHLCQNPDEFNIAHLDLLAQALGVKPSELVKDAEEDIR